MSLSKKIATFKDLDTLASLDTGTSAGYISGVENEQCVTKGNFDTVSTKTIEAKGNGLMFVDGSDSSNYESNRLILLDDVKYISEITAVLVSAPNIPAEGGIACATWLLTQYYKTTGSAQPLRDEWTVDGSNVSADSKGTTPSDVTNVANSTITVTRNGKSISLSQMIKQDSNEIISYGGWSTPTVTVSPNSFAAAGGTGTITISGDCKRENTWSSGSKSTDTASMGNISATLGTLSSNYETLTIGVNTSSFSKNGKVTAIWLFDGSAVKIVESNIYTQVTQTTCTMTLTGSIAVYHNTAYITGIADVEGKIYWGTESNNMSNEVEVSAGESVEIIKRIELGKTTIYAYFVPSDSNYTSLGSSTIPFTSACAEITKATDASISITTSNATYNGSAQTVVTCNPTDGVHGVSDWAIGYTTSKDANVSSVIWASSKTNLTLTNVGTYYIWKKWTADSNHSNGSDGEMIDATVVISKKSVTVTAGTTSKIYDGSALTYDSVTLSGQVSGHTLNSYSISGSITDVGSTDNTPSKAKIYSGSTDVTSNYSITYNKGTLSITARPVTFTATSQTKVYDGTALSASNTATLTSGTLVSGHTASFTCSATSVTNVGSSTKSISNVTIKDGSGNVVTYNYNITKKTGKLTINKATPSLTFNASSSTLTYSGSSQNIGTISYNGDGKFYYVVSTSTTVPTSGWTEVTSGTTIKSSAATAATYYVYLKSDAGTNYNAVSATANGGSKEIGKATPTLTFTASSSELTYNGLTQNIGTISYNGDGNFYYVVSTSTTVPTSGWTEATSGTTIESSVAAATYYVYLKSTAGTNYKAVSATANSGSKEIGKATPTLTFNASSSTLTYNGLTQNIGTISYNGDGNFYYVVSTSTTVPTSGWAVGSNGETIKSSAATATTYYVYLKSGAGTNYAAVTGANKGNKTIDTRTVTITEPTKTDCTYTGYGQTIFAAGSCTAGGTMYYSETNTTFSTSTWKTTIPYTKKTNAGTYTMYYYCYVSDTTNNTGSGINTVKSISATIGKKATTAPILSRGYKYRYDGTTVYAKAYTLTNPAGTIYYGESPYATTYSITASATSTDLTDMGRSDVGTTTIYAFFRPTDTENYSDSPVESTTVDVLYKATPTMKLNSVSKTYDGVASYVTGSSDTPGKIYYGTSETSMPYLKSVDGDIEKYVNLTGSVDVVDKYVYAYFVPDDTTNYESLGSSSEYYKYTYIRITQRKVEITKPSTIDCVYTGSDQTIFAAGSCTAGGTMYYSETNEPFNISNSSSPWSKTIPYTKKTNVGTYTLYYYCYVSDTTNNKGTGINTIKSISATIDKATATITYENLSNLSVQCLNDTVMHATKTLEFTKATTTGGSVIYTTDTDRFQISGEYIVVPIDTPAGTYNVSITASQGDSNFTSNTVKRSFSISVLEDVLGDLTGTLSFDNSTLSAGADTRVITFGAVHQQWVYGGAKVYPSGSSMVTFDSGIYDTAGSYISLENVINNNNSSTVTTTLSKETYGVTLQTPVEFSISLMFNNSILITKNISAQANSSSLTKVDAEFGKPSISIGDTLTAANSDATVSCSVINNVRKTYTWTSGSTSYITEDQPGNVGWSIYNQSCAGGSSRFAVAGNKIVHSSMGTNEGTDTVVIIAGNADDTTKTSTLAKTILNYKVHTLTGVNLLYVNPASSAAGSSNEANVTYSTSYIWPSGAAGSTTADNTTEKLNSVTTFTKNFAIVTNNTNATLDTSTGLVTWNSVNTGSNRSIAIQCTGTLTSFGNTTSKTSQTNGAVQSGGASATTSTFAINYMNGGIASGVSCVIQPLGVTQYNVTISSATGLIGSVRYDTYTSVPVTIRVSNTSGSGKTLTVSYTNGTSTTATISPTSGSLYVPNGGSITSYYVTVTVNRASVSTYGVAVIRVQVS